MRIPLRAWLAGRRPRLDKPHVRGCVHVRLVYSRAMQDFHSLGVCSLRTQVEEVFEYPVDSNFVDAYE
jgi:hypothetical protein